MKSNLRLTLPLVAVAVLALTALTFIADDRIDPETSISEATTPLEEGDILTHHGQFEAARQAYLVAARMVRDRGELPETELRRIANAYYFEGRYEDAAATLRRLAAEARRHGNVDGRVLAIADAIWLSALSGDAAIESRLRDELRAARESSELSEDVRRRTATDPTDSLRVLAPHLTV